MIDDSHNGRYRVVLIMLRNAGVANAYGSAMYGREGSYYALLDSLMGW